MGTGQRELRLLQLLVPWICGGRSMMLSLKGLLNVAHIHWIR